nr:MAG TPA: hypothetical protein [Caudoviricetes sp.]
MYLGYCFEDFADPVALGTLTVSCLLAFVF